MGNKMRNETFLASCATEYNIFILLHDFKIKNAYGQKRNVVGEECNRNHSEPIEQIQKHKHTPTETDRHPTQKTRISKHSLIQRIYIVYTLHI